MAKFIPTMGVKGWTDTPEEVADYIISCFLATNQSQSVSHRTQNTSLQYILKQNAGRMYDLEQDLRTVLNKKMQDAFDPEATADVNVTADPEDPAKFSIEFLGTVYTNGRAITVGKLVQFQDSRIINIAKINNGE